MYELWEGLKRAKEYKWVELSHPLDNDSPFWAGIPEGSVELCKTVYDWGNPMLDCLIQTFCFPGQFGTHIDFPSHFDKEGVSSEAYGVEQLVFPLCVIDVTDKVAQDVHYAVTVQDILDYETKYGPIPEGAFVALRTDWSKRWPSMDALSNFDAEGGEHTPGWSMEALKYIYETRSAAANGHETIDTDASALAAQAGDLACERYVLSHGKVQVELLCNLDQVAPAGAVVMVSLPPHYRRYRSARPGLGGHPLIILIPATVKRSAKRSSLYFFNSISTIFSSFLLFPCYNSYIIAF